ncbi:uncharacterized protein TM35_001521010 [Trypanosoma theileri]|uniref:Uncharacterized protein n=1 Tax=Trypanosoma theileri TaxID=67003 RepID=A0A1X0NDD8_9TRYP|nr:uncharacterized protein TM35_001521010 [Trypanosoma theileri]ORC80615.1 hypothetical protein TM35_001521010 [Trypanosoma theileri]
MILAKKNGVPPKPVEGFVFFTFPISLKMDGHESRYTTIALFSLFVGLECNALTHLTLCPLYGVCGHILSHIAIEATTMLLLYDGVTPLVWFVFFTWVVFFLHTGCDAK